MTDIADRTRLRWLVGTVTAVRDETPTARTLVLEVPDWPGHRAGQHVDIRLTAPDGYSTQRSYSIASAPEATSVEVAVQRIVDGEVSPYLTGILEVGDQIELRGPVGGWFVWPPDSTDPTLLVAGGSGIVPLMAMIRTRARVRSNAPFRLLYSVRDRAAALFAAELDIRAHGDPGLSVSYVFTRTTPDGWPRPPGRIVAADLDAVRSPGGPTAGGFPAVFVCGPTAMVESVADLLIGAGFPPARIKTERFGESAPPG